MITLVVWYALAQWAAQPPMQPGIEIDCAPPPKITVTVPCEPGEGCDEKWIFVPREEPSS